MNSRINTKKRDQDMTAYMRQKEKISNHLAFESSHPPGGKLFTSFLLWTPVVGPSVKRRHLQKETFTKELEFFDNCLAPTHKPDGILVPKQKNKNEKKKKKTQRLFLSFSLKCAVI